MSPGVTVPATRHFTRVEGRDVAYRRLGKGPAVLVLHGSPQSSRAVMGVAQALAGRGLCAICPDTPGAGRSDPLPGARPQSEDYARHLAGLADALGLGRVGLYGFHTGAATACAFAGLYPERTAAATLEGLPAWTSAEAADATAHYLPTFEPQWDGSHMAWLWARMEEQSLFFPWHSPTPEARMAFPVTGAEAVHANCMDLLDAGDAYRSVYHAAFDFKVAAWLPRLTAPALIAVTGFDVLADHLQRPELAGRGRVFDTLAALHAAAADLLAGSPGDAAPEAPTLPDRGFVAMGSEVLAWRRQDGRGRPTLRLHAAGDAMPEQSPGVALDLPGHGDSAEGWAEAPRGLAGWTNAAAEACRALGMTDAAAEGLGVGGAIAVELAHRGIAASGRILGPGAGPLPAVGFGSISLRPEWDGAHLIRAWRVARYGQLFHPWHARDPAHARKPFETLDTATVHRRAINLLKAHDRWLAAATLEA